MFSQGDYFGGHHRFAVLSSRKGTRRGADTASLYSKKKTTELGKWTVTVVVGSNQSWGVSLEGLGPLNRPTLTMKLGEKLQHFQTDGNQLDKRAEILFQRPIGRSNYGGGGDSAPNCTETFLSRAKDPIELKGQLTGKNLKGLVLVKDSANAAR